MVLEGLRAGLSLEEGEEGPSFIYEMTGPTIHIEKSTCHFINKGRGTQTERANTYTPRHRFKGGICRTVLARVEFMSLRHDFVWSEPAARLR